MASTVPHVLVDQTGSVLRTASFAPGVLWREGEIVRLGAGELYRILERRDGDTVVLVVEPV